MTIVKGLMCMETLVKMENIQKSFPGVHALDNCKFDLVAGEVHALMGENGAGKSTLMKILTGVYTKDSGITEIKGVAVNIANPKHAKELGISIIHQELNLCQHLTVAQNIFIGRELKDKTGIIIDEKKMNQKAQEFLDMLKVDIAPDEKVLSLTVAKEQMIEIVKSISYNAEVLIMDEPTSSLTTSEIDKLFEIIEYLKKKNVGIVYISHRMDEIMRIADRITVMRDGQYINTVKAKDTNINEIIKMMIGRELKGDLRPEGFTRSNEVVFEVKNLNRKNIIKNVSFNLKKGEVLGFAGLMGAGRTEVARAIFGADKKDSGEIYIKGKKVDIDSPKDAVKHGIGYLSEDRKKFGLALGLDVVNNSVLASYEKFISKLGIIQDKKCNESASVMVKKLGTKTPSLVQKVKNLSGGNQQKVIIGKWLIRDCDILIFDEPTRGIDVGAKSEIYKLIKDLADSGRSVIVISSELPEILRLSHRIYVMCEGAITGEIMSEDANQENIMTYATMRGDIAK